MSITETSSWIAKLKAGDECAAQKLWEDYHQRLVNLARQKLRDLPRRAADEEDVANSALKSLLLGLGRGQFPRIGDRHNLWSLLIVITARKALELQRRERRARRGGGKVRGDSALDGTGGSPGPHGLDGLAGSEPTPEFVVQAAEEFQELLARLGREDLQRVALWKMENYTNDEIAKKAGCSRPTIERKLRLIRKIWEKEAAR